MEQATYSILFIDDHSINYLLYLVLGAKASGFKLYVTNNVQDGLDFLKSYNDIVSAVILDISFPKGEIQGFEALQKINQQHPQQLVIMLTDIDYAEDINRVLECMKKDAYNYVGKRSLNPVYLFHFGDNAVQLAQIQMRLNTMEHYLEPDFKRADLLKLPNFNCIARLMPLNIPSDPFVFQTKNELNESNTIFR